MNRVAPLEGIVVVALEQALAVPFATRQLADLGARVIKIERPISGDFARHYDSKVEGLSSAFTWLGRGKESIALDIKEPEDKEILNRLIARCDVFLHNISPSAARRSGLESSTLMAKHPKLIAGSVSGYGNFGAMKDSKAYDLLIQGETGIMSITGTEEHMAKVGISVADIAAGMYVYSSVLAAVLHRTRTGEPLPVDISLFDSLVEWLSYPLYYTLYGGTAPTRMGTNHATIAPYGVFTTADGEQTLLAVQNDREWSRLCTTVLKAPSLLVDPRFATAEKRITNRMALDETINDYVGVISRNEFLERLHAAEIAHGRLNDIRDLGAHEQIVDRNRWIETDSPSGLIKTLLPPWLPHAKEGQLGSIPDVGEHTERICQWLGVEKHKNTSWRK